MNRIIPLRLLAWLLVVFAALNLVGCASSRLSETIEKQIKNVAIVSLVPEKANFEKVGLTVYNNENAQIDLGPRITTTIEDVATKRLNVARPGWTVKKIAYDRNALIDQIKRPGFVMAYSEEKIEKQLAELSRINDLDAIVVVTSRRYENTPGDGVGIYLRTLSLSSIGSAVVHSNISVMIAGADGKINALAIGFAEPPKSLDVKALGLQYDLNSNFRLDLMNQLSDEMIAHLTKSLNRRFNQLGM